ncbi:uncharacterized protein LOC127101152 [Lathyrus oleraceus]|uniref:uncharacterized protein LOC127101152 n=1 Tax=Pisum sativum TaxID=3888 RepID=UPI0021CEEB11|nr:uncharacterized protein LOC127101152 [Pisum sativum]
MTHVMAQANEALLVNQQANQNQNGEDDEFRGQQKFQKNNPLTFKGRYDPNAAHPWIKVIEKISRVMACTNALKMLFRPYTLYEKAVTGGRIPEFLDKHFPADAPNPKKIEFLELKQDNMYMVDYAAKFEELSWYCPQYNGVDA